MKILCLFVRHGPAAYPEALPRLDAWYESHGLSASRTLWIIDNQLPAGSPSQTFARHTRLMAGDNSAREFSAWQKILRECSDEVREFDLVHFVTSAFNVLYTGYLDHFDPEMLDYVLQHNACLGHLDGYDAPIQLGGVTSQCWMRTCFFFLPARTALSLEAWAAYQGLAGFFASDSREFRRTAPLSKNYQRYVTSWLTGHEQGGYAWHSPVGDGVEEARRFQHKAVSVFNEHRLAISLRQAGVPLVDFCWRWATRNLPATPNPARLSELDQIRFRSRKLSHSPIRVSQSEILAELGRIEYFKAKAKLELQRLPGNRSHPGAAERSHFLVLSTGTIVCHLTVGRDLAQRHRGSRAFATACPAIACQPLFWHQAGALDYLGTEYFAGIPLEAAILEDKISAKEATAVMQRLMAALDSTLLPSNKQQAGAEFARLADDICALPFLNGLDHQLLRETILPRVRTGALTGPFQTRWTNGNLISRNVLVNQNADVRLIDCRHAQRTHFYPEDGWLWQAFSPAPGKGFKVSVPGCPGTPDKWQEALFILRRILLAGQTLGRVPAAIESRNWIKRLMATVTSSEGNFRGSFFLESLTRDETEERPELHERNLLKAQLADLQKNFASVEKDRIGRGKVIETQGKKLTKLEADFDARLKELKALYASAEATKNERNLLQAQLADLQQNFTATEKDRADRGQVIENLGNRISELEKLIWLTEQNRDWWKTEAERQAALINHRPTPSS